MENHDQPRNLPDGHALLGAISCDGGRANSWFGLSDVTGRRSKT